MIAIASQAAKGTLISLKNIHIGTLKLGRIVGYTLHQHKILVACLFYGTHSLINLRHRSITRSKHNGNILTSNIVQHL